MSGDTLPARFDRTELNSEITETTGARTRLSERDSKGIRRNPIRYERNALDHNRRPRRNGLEISYLEGSSRWAYLLPALPLQKDKFFTFAAGAAQGCPHAYSWPHTNSLSRLCEKATASGVR